MKLLLTILLCLLALLVVITIMLGIEMLILPPLAALTGLDWLINVPLTAGVIALLIVLPGHKTALPIRYRIRASTLVESPPAQVWNLIAPRNSDSYWGAVITGTRIASDNPNHISFLFEGPEARHVPKALEAEIMGVEPDRYFAYRPLNADQFPLFTGDLVLVEYQLEDLGDQTRVTLIEHLERLRLSAIPLLLFLNPCRDALIRLKAEVESQPDTSWMGLKVEQLRDAEMTNTLGTYNLFKWGALAMLPFVFTLFLISFIGS